jgi:hypothetical protein
VLTSGIKDHFGLADFLHFTRGANMEGASDPNLATALAAQPKSIETQSKTLAAQSKILQQLCDRLESQDHRWGGLEKVVHANTENIAKLHDKLGQMIDTQITEMQAAQQERVDEIVAHTSTRLAVLENVTKVFESWRPRMEGLIETIQTSVEAVRSELARVSHNLERDESDNRATTGQFKSTAQRSPAAMPRVDDPGQQGYVPHHREFGFGESFQTQLPNNGTHDQAPFHHHVPFQYHEEYVPAMHHTYRDFSGGYGQGPPSLGSLGNLPKLNFPMFDGENPKLWQSRCEAYFHMYTVDPSVWVQVAYMQFTGPAARWLQSIEFRLSHISWGEFCHLIQDSFAKNQHQSLLRRLFHIQQMGTVSSYVEEFAQLIDQLNAYHTMPDPLYYTLKFVEGLKDDIKAVVMLQRPSDFDTAVVLAQLQEEAGDLGKKRDYKKPYSGFQHQAPPPSVGVQASSSKEVKQASTTSSTDNKMAALSAYRKAQGFCYKCGMTYSRGHLLDTIQGRLLMRTMTLCHYRRSVTLMTVLEKS